MATLSPIKNLYCYIFIGWLKVLVILIITVRRQTSSSLSSPSVVSVVSKVGVSQLSPPPSGLSWLVTSSGPAVSAQESLSWPRTGPALEEEAGRGRAWLRINTAGLSSWQWGRTASAHLYCPELTQSVSQLHQSWHQSDQVDLKYCIIPGEVSRAPGVLSTPVWLYVSQSELSSLMSTSELTAVQ